MITNLFSMFDPSSSFLGLGWAILLVVLFFFPTNNFNIDQPKLNHLNIIFLNIENEISQLIGNSNNNISSINIINIFILVMLLNILALFPFNFTPTAHMLVTLILSLTLWIATILNGWTNTPNHILIHITPIGTPTPLINFMVLIETVSNLIRPITLSVRLSANIVAGHLLISLLSNFSLSSQTNINLSFIIIIALSILEIIVALIQAYVIVTLTTLYQNESM